MKKKFHRLKVSSIEKSTPDCVIISFEVEKQLEDAFKFRAGQYLTIRTDIDGDDVRRSYSLCSSPAEGKWRVAVKEVDGGLFSQYANQVLRKGEELLVMPPDGRFGIASDPTSERNYVAFAAGSGITPVISIIKSLLHDEPNSTFKLFYVNQSVSSIILKEEVEALKNVYMNRFEIYHFLTREERNVPLYNGRITPDKLQIIFDSLVDQDSLNDVFLCGPEPFIFMIRDFLLARNVAAKKIHFELFVTAGQEYVPRKAVAAGQVSGKSCSVTIIEGGKQFTFELPGGNTTILDGALTNAADLPFACKGGVCCTCRAQLLEGEVEMKVNYGLEPEEVEAGFILTCQSIPLTDKVVVDYDT